MQGPCSLRHYSHFLDEEVEALRRLHGLAKFTSSLGDSSWDHVSFTRHLKVCRDDNAKSICKTERCFYVWPLVQFLMTCTRQVQTQRPKGSCPETQQKFGLDFLVCLILLFKTERAIQVRGRDGCKKWGWGPGPRWDIRKKGEWPEEAKSARLPGKGRTVTSRDPRVF